MTANVLTCALSMAASAALAFAAPSSGQIEARELGGIDPFSIPLADEAGALRSTAWEGADAAAAALLLEALASDSRESVAAGRIIAAVLRTGATPPGGGQAPRALASARVRALYNAGLIDDVTQLAGLDATLAADADYGLPVTLSRFLQGDASGACRTAEGVNVDPTDAQWARVRAACFALAGSLPAAELTLDTVRGQLGQRVDARFDYWVARAAGAPPIGDAEAPRGALELVLALSAGSPPLAEDLEGLDIAALVAVARSPAVSDVTRLAAALAAAESGVLGADALEPAFAAAAQGETRSARQILSDGVAEDEGEYIALLTKAVLTAETEALRAEAIAAVFGAAPSHGQAFVMAEYLAPVVSNMPINLDTVVFAELFAEIAAIAAQPDTARAWAEAARNAGPHGVIDDPAVLEADFLFRMAGLDLLLAVADPSTSSDVLASAVGAYLDVAQTTDQIASANRAAQLVLALGATNTGALRASASAGAGASTPLSAEAQAALSAMDSASDAGVLAETALQAARLLQVAGGDNSFAAARVVRNFWRFGLDREARLVALEALMAERRRSEMSLGDVAE